MSGIESYLALKALDDVAVYWASPLVAFDGSNTFADPIEIGCVWRELTEVIRDNEGREIISAAVVYVSQDLDEQGMLFHGTLVDFSTAEEEDPKKVSNAYEILKFKKIPSLYLKGDFNRTAIIGHGKAIGG